MKTIYLDCSAGISGNMFLGGLIGLGLPEAHLKSELAKLAIAIPEIMIKTVQRKGIKAILFDVHEVHEHHQRHLDDITQIITGSGLNSKVVENAIKVFTNLAEAEAKIHGVSIQEIHFHEVGAVDAIVDIVGACIGLDYFGIYSMVVSPIRVGFGTITCAHGEMPIPAPATVELLQGFPVFGGEFAGEWATPTGAAIVKTFTIESGSLPPMKVERVGYGAGTRDCLIPNVVRLIIGEVTNGSNRDDIQTIIETNVDDMNPEIYSYLGDLFLKTGAKDYYFTPVQMKKGRPGVLITVVAPPEKVTELEELLFKETTTLGIRKYNVQRSCLERNKVTVIVQGFTIKVKTAFYQGQLIKYAPEYEDCVQASKNINHPLREIYEEAIFQARKILQK
jgi:uncharacterized protein (TIGR00299 family) protein